MKKNKVFKSLSKEDLKVVKLINYMINTPSKFSVN